MKPIYYLKDLSCAKHKLKFKLLSDELMYGSLVFKRKLSSHFRISL